MLRKRNPIFELQLLLINHTAGDEWFNEQSNPQRGGSVGGGGSDFGINYGESEETIVKEEDKRDSLVKLLEDLRQRSVRETGTRATAGTEQVASTTAVTGTERKVADVQTQTTGVASQLDAGTRSTLQELLQQFAPAAAAGAQGSEQILALLQDRASNAPGAIDISAIVDESRRKGELAIGKQEAFLGAQAGSRLNTLVQGEVGQSRAALESALAGQESTLQLQQRESVTDELIATLEASGVPSRQLTELADVLKGAETVTEATQAEASVVDATTATEQISDVQTELSETVVSDLTRLLSERNLSREELIAVTEILTEITKRDKEFGFQIGWKTE